MKPTLFFLFTCCGCLSFSSLLFAQEKQTKADEKWLEILRADPRLQTKFKYDFKGKPGFDEVFDTLKKMSGVSMALAEEPADGKVVWGGMSGHNVPVWWVMRDMAREYFIDGKWEKAQDGYALHGKPKKIITPAEEAQQIAFKKKADEARAKAMKAKEDFTKWHPLGNDRRLRIKMTILEKDPKFFSVLDRVSAITGYKITVADNLANHDPILGVFQMKDVFAYSFMEIVQKKDIDNGHWVKTEDGYRLEGVSRLLASAPLAPTVRTFPWGWVLGAMTTMVLAGCGFFVYRRRSKKTAVPQKP